MSRQKEGLIRTREETEKGDVAKSLQSLIESQYISKRFKDIMGATRLTRKEIISLAVMEINRVTMKILSISDDDVNDPNITPEEKTEIAEMVQLRKRFMKNPTALAYVLYDSFMYMYALGKQSLGDGMSRREGVEIAGGGMRHLVYPEELGRFDRIKRRLFGDVLFPER